VQKLLYTYKTIFWLVYLVPTNNFLAKHLVSLFQSDSLILRLGVTKLSVNLEQR